MVFGSVVKEEQQFENDDPDIEGFDEFILNTDMEDGMLFTGKPFLGEMYQFDYEGNPNFRANLWIINNENKEVLKTQLKLKSMEDNLTFWNKSVGFDIVDSIETLEDEKFKGKHNKLNISFKELYEYLNSLKEITVETKAHKAEINGNLTFWNTLRVTGVV